jgi:transposase-like protein
MATTTMERTELVETGDRRDELGRRIVPAARKAELVRAYSASGLTQAAFARREGVKYSTFAHWVQLALKAAEKGSVRFAEVRLPLPAPRDSRAAARLEVRLVDGTVLSGNDATELAALVRAVRA